MNLYFDFKNKSINKNIDLLGSMLKDVVDDCDLINKNRAKTIIALFFYELSNEIEKKSKLLYEMKNEYFENNYESITLEIDLIEKEIIDFNNDESIDFISVFNIAKNYADAYVIELSQLISIVKENQYIDCEECNSFSEYLEEHRAYCCSNEDCGHEMEL